MYSLIFEIDPDRAVPDFDGIGGDADLGDVAADAIGELKLPLVPGTGDDAVGDATIMQRGAAMGADIVDGEEAIRVAEEADLDVAELDATAFANRNVFQLQGGVDVGHVG